MVGKYLVLDMDGTLYHKRHEDRAVAEMARRLYAYTDMHGIPRDGVSKIVNRDIRYLRISSLVYRLSKKFGLDTRDFVNYAYDVHPSSFGIRRRKKLVRLLRRLDRTWRIILFTNSPMIWTERVMDTLGLTGIIDRKDTISFETLGYGRHMKPGDGAFRILLKRTGSDPKDLVLLEDTYTNVMAARRTGIMTVRISNKPARERGREKDILAALGDLLEK